MVVITYSSSMPSSMPNATRIFCATAGSIRMDGGIEKYRSSGVGGIEYASKHLHHHKTVMVRMDH
jgi:hypothetical protein